MSNDFGRNNDFMRNETRDARQSAGLSAHVGGGAAQRATPAAGLDPQRFGADQFNELLTTNLLSARPPEDFSRLFPHLEPVSLAVLGA